MLSPTHLEAIKDQYRAGGKEIAFTAIGTTGTLGIAVKNEPGYYLIPEYWHYDPDYNSLSEYADKLNEEVLELSPKEAMYIVVSSLRGTVKTRG